LTCLSFFVNQEGTLSTILMPKKTTVLEGDSTQLSLLRPKKSKKAERNLTINIPSTEQRVTARSRRFGNMDVINPQLLPGWSSFDVPIELIINASPERCWEVLLDFSSYPRWNPFHRKVEGELKVGKPIKMAVYWGNKGPNVPLAPLSQCQNVEEQFHCIDHQRHILMYGLDFKVIISERIQAMLPFGDGQTRYISHDLIGGILAGITQCCYMKSMNDGFKTQMEAFKNYVEANDQPRTPRLKTRRLSTRSPKKQIMRD